MTKNPFINALIASLYIAAVSSLMFFGQRFAAGEDTIAAPIAMLSLLTLSVAVMAFTFFYQPISLLIKGDHASAFKLLLKTIGFFAGITALLFGILLSTWFFQS